MNNSYITKVRKDSTLSFRIAKEDKDLLKSCAKKVSMPIGEFSRALLELAMEDYLNALELYRLKEEAREKAQRQQRSQPVTSSVSQQ